MEGWSLTKFINKTFSLSDEPSLFYKVCKYGLTPKFLKFSCPKARDDVSGHLPNNFLCIETSKFHGIFIKKSWVFHIFHDENIVILMVRTWSEVLPLDKNMDLGMVSGRTRYKFCISVLTKMLRFYQIFEVFCCPPTRWWT